VTRLIFAWKARAHSSPVSPLAQRRKYHPVLAPCITASIGAVPCMAREARRARGQHIGRPKVLDKKKAALAQRMHASGESASVIAATRGVSRATDYRVLAEQADSDD
jgi:hypothetical protein